MKPTDRDTLTTELTAAADPWPIIWRRPDFDEDMHAPVEMFSLTDGDVFYALRGHWMYATTGTSVRDLADQFTETLARFDATGPQRIAAKGLAERTTR